MMKRVIIAAGLTALLIPGCMKPFARNANHPDFAAVTVRFVVPPDPDRILESRSENQAQLAADSSYNGYSDENQMWRLRPYYVALWGDQYGGNDVTYRPAELRPGRYSFAYFDKQNQSSLQGWVWMNNTAGDTVDFLQNWRVSIPQQRQWLAYDFELQSKFDPADANTVQAFEQSLKAFDQLEHRLNQAIKHEQYARQQTLRRNRKYLGSANLLILPGYQSFFNTTTRAAFTEEDVQLVQNGQPLTKMMLVADFDMAKWKLDHINNLYRDLNAIKGVLTEEVDRLERRKRMYTLTDHLYHHDQKFVENEIQLQQTIAVLDRYNQWMNELRERRTALSFATALVATDDWFAPIEEERKDLTQERTVLETKSHWIDQKFDQCSEDSPHRVTWERQRQNTLRQIRLIDQQLDQLAQARTALEDLRNQTEIIHRQGDTWLLTANQVDQSLPFSVWEAIHREALMTVRLEHAEHLFAPSIKNVTPVQTVSDRFWWPYEYQEDQKW